MLGTFRVGESIEIALDAARGDVTEVSELVAHMALAYRENGPLKGLPIELMVTDRAADGNNPAGWILSLTAEQSAVLPVGVYALDAKLSLDGDTTEITTRTAYIQITKSTFG